MEQVLYQLPDGWIWRKVSELAKTTSGGTPSRSNKDYWGGSIPWVKSGELGDSRVEKNEEFITELGLKNSSAKLFPKESLLLALYGATAGKLGVLTYDAATNQAVCCISQDDQLLARDFLRYYLLSQRKKIIEDSFGGAQPNISQAYVREIDIPTPPLTEQKRIVDKLDALLTRIDTAIEHLQESVTLADALSKNGLSEIFESLKDRYEVVPLSSVVKINSGIALPKLFKNGFSDGDIPFFKVAQMNNHHETMVAPEITFNETVATEHKIKLFPKGSTLIPKRGGAILTNKKRMLLEDASYDSNIMGLKADESKISDEYLFAFMRTIDLANFVDASTIPQVNNKHIDQMQIPLASIEEQPDVVSRVNLLVKKVETMNSEIQRQLDDLQALKSSILDTAFKGEL